MAGNRLRNIEVHNFRPFGQQQFPVAPDRNIILLYGNNGFGKTSFFDAVEWGVTGKLARYEAAARERNEYGVLRNQFVSGDEAWVKLEFDGGQTLTRHVRASGNGDYNEGEADGDPSQWLVRPEWGALVDLAEAFNLTHLLTQEQVNRFVRSTKDTERYAAMVSLFGLSGYEAYNPKLEEIRRTAVQRKEGFEREKGATEQEIARKEASMGSMGIDAGAKRTELAGLLGVDVAELRDVREVQRRIQNEAPGVTQELAAAETRNREIAYVAQNWSASEAANHRIGGLRASVDENQRLATACNDLAGCRWVRASRDVYAQYRSDLQLVARLEGELGAFLASPVGLLSQIDADARARMLEISPSLGGDAGDLARRLVDARTAHADAAEKARQLEGVLATQCGLERRMIQLARDFFAENSGISQCPVCTSRIDASEVMQALEARIRSDSSALFRDSSDRLRALKDEAAARKQDIEALTRQVLDVLGRLRGESITAKTSLEDRLTKAKEQATTGENIERWLAHLQTSSSEIEQVHDRLVAAIRGSREYVEGQEAKEFYESRRDGFQAELPSLQQGVVTYNQLKTRHSLATPEGLSQATAQAAASLDGLRNRKARTDASLRLIGELQQSDRDARTRTEISGLRQQVAGLDRRLRACQQVETDCAQLRGATRRVVEEETNRLLGDYGTTIKRIYTHLNPHVRLGRLDFRIDASNRANNRLIFEALDPTGEVKVNPSYTFSSAQTNVLAISVFLGIALRQQWSNLNALFLDDPIQNMDDINVHSFVDIIRSVVRDTGKQFFISTHDERVFQFMRRKFRHDLQVFRFTGYGQVVREPTVRCSGEQSKADQSDKRLDESQSRDGFVDW
jgi:exonuclease SbcC